MARECFHPVSRDWFLGRFGDPTEPQRLAWPAIASGRDTLIAAPTGSGKTLAAFFYCLDALLRRGLERGALEPGAEVLYVSPLKALSNDVKKNLEEPLAGLRALALERGLSPAPIEIAVRTGDTAQAERQRLAKRPPHILVTTPESLFILLTSESGRRALAGVRTVIVDEIHAVAGDKRGAHLALSLERLDRLVGQAGLSRPVRIGLSATQKPIDEIARFLVGRASGDCTVIEIGSTRELDLSIEIPSDELSAVAPNETWAEVYDRIADMIRAHRTTIVFVNTRRLVERVAHALGERLGDGGVGAAESLVAAHHGSLSRKTRLEAEQRLKEGRLRAIVATASLELGIDIGEVDLVCQIGSPRAIRTLLQRVGRSGHRRGGVPKGRLFALTRDQLLECGALVRAARTGEIDRIEVRRKPLDILAQQVVAMAACEEWSEAELLEAVRGAYPYRDISADELEAVLAYVSEGIARGRGRAGAHVHRDLVNRRLRGRRGARLAAITSGGAIPDVADYDVVAEPEGTFVGKVDEDFAVESMAGDVFLLGNTSWRILRVERGRVRVADAHGANPSVPFWRAEAPSRTEELSEAVSRLREEVEARLDDPGAAVVWLERETGMPRAGAEQAVRYIAATRALLGAVPSQRQVVAERFFDEAGGMQLVIHAPFGGRVNRAWGLALRKRFCRSFDFELQAAATDDGIVLSLGPQHSFPLEAVFTFLRADTARATLEQAVLPAPMFGTRWRWNATRALALLRFRSGRKVPMPIQRMQSEDLLAAVFPAVIACPENHEGGDIEIPDHPLIEETLKDCFEEAMDLAGLERVLRALERGEIRTVARDTPEPSPMSHEILNANPYAFLDDAPLEERRARAVETRRGLPDEIAHSLGALDPEAIATVWREAWPEARDADELHDALLTLGVLPEADVVGEWRGFAEALVGARRASWRAVSGGGGPREARVLVAAEREAVARALYGSDEPEAAAVQVVRGWLSCTGVTTARELAGRLGLRPALVEAALARIEGEGTILRGKFRPEADPRGAEVQWCDRALLARIHRLTIGRLRREIEPVSTVDLVRFLLRWQHVAPGTQLHGEAGLRSVIAQLQGFELAAGAWEPHVLRARVAGYRSTWLDLLTLSGEVVWGRLAHRGRAGAVGKAAPLALVLREDLPWLLEAAPDRPASGADGSGDGDRVGPALSHAARDVHDFLATRGALFFPEIVAGSGRLKTEVDEALRELVAAGLVTADGFQALRTLISPREQRPPRPWRVRDRAAGAPEPAGPPGRWSLLRAGAPPLERDAYVEKAARQLLRRWGVVFRDLLAREARAPAWRELVLVYRRLEARGEIRGGRFVAGQGGEHFALPEAVEALRALRRAEPTGEVVRLAATDPLNLVGIITPGARVPAVLGNEVAYRDGVPVEEAVGAGRPA